VCKWEGILLVAIVIACAAVWSIPITQSWAEDEKLTPPKKLTGRDAVNALVGNTIVMNDFPKDPFGQVDAVYFAPDGVIWATTPSGAGGDIKWSIRGNQICFGKNAFLFGTQWSSEDCQPYQWWEVEGARATINFTMIEGHHIQIKRWILPGNALNFPEGNVEGR
jgi:hypothetical protein